MIYIYINLSNLTINVKKSRTSVNIDQKTEQGTNTSFSQTR